MRTHRKVKIAQTRIIISEQNPVPDYQQALSSHQMPSLSMTDCHTIQQLKQNANLEPSKNKNSAMKDVTADRVDRRYLEKVRIPSKPTDKWRYKRS